MFQPIVKNTRLLIMSTGILTMLCGMLTVHHILNSTSLSRAQALHNTSKSNIVGALTSANERLAVVAKNPVLVDFLIEHRTKFGNQPAGSSEQDLVREQLNSEFAPHYLESTHGGRLDIAYQLIAHLPEWAITEILTPTDKPVSVQVRSLSHLAGFNDFTLIDIRSGRIVLTGSKRFDIGASLMNEPLIASDLGRAFSEMIDWPQGARVLDLIAHEPFIAGMTLAIGAPIHAANGKLEGIIIGHISIAQVDRWLNRNGQWDQLGYAANEQSYLIGEDGIIRSQWRPFSEHPDKFIRDVAHRSGTTLAAKLMHQQSTAGMVKISNSWILSQIAHKNLAKGESEDSAITMESLPIPGLNWKLVTETKPITHSWIWAAISTALALFGFALSFYFHARFETTADQLMQASELRVLLTDQGQQQEQQVNHLTQTLAQVESERGAVVAKLAKKISQHQIVINAAKNEAARFKLLFKRECLRADEEFNTNLELSAALQEHKEVALKNKASFEELRTETHIHKQLIGKHIEACEQMLKDLGQDHNGILQHLTGVVAIVAKALQDANFQLTNLNTQLSMTFSEGSNYDRLSVLKGTLNDVKQHILEAQQVLQAVNMRQTNNSHIAKVLNELNQANVEIKKYSA